MVKRLADFRGRRFAARLPEADTAQGSNAIQDYGFARAAPAINVETG